MRHNPFVYDDLDLRIGPAPTGSGYAITVEDGPCGPRPAAALRVPPVLAECLDDLLCRLERRILRDAQSPPLITRDARRTTPRATEPDDIDPRAFGGELFRFLFNGTTREALIASLAAVEGQPDRGLRIRLRFDPRHASALASLPWELLHRPETNDFLASSIRSPIIRHLDVQRTRLQPKTLRALRILVAISDPQDVDPLDVDHEATLLRRTLGSRDGIALRFLERPTMKALRRCVRQEPFDIFHFIGHGGQDDDGHGVLYFEDEDRRAAPVRGETLAANLIGAEPIRLVFLNACESARLPRIENGGDPYHGVASALLLAGIPAAIAMQFKVGDRAAAELSDPFYDALAAGDSVETAMVEARLALKTQFPDSWEWATPALYMGVRHGNFFRPPEAVERTDPELSASPAPGPDHSSNPTTDVTGDKAREPLAEAIELIDYQDYTRALELLEGGAHARSSAEMCFYRALARLRGKRPRSARPGIVRSIESDLSAATRHLDQRDEPAAHVILLRAMIKIDFYRMNGLREQPPTTEDLLADAETIAIFADPLQREALERILRHVPTPENPVRKAINARLLALRAQ